MTGGKGAVGSDTGPGLNPLLPTARGPVRSLGSPGPASPGDPMPVGPPR